MKDIYVLIGCEESQAIANEFRKLGVKAFSCDLKRCSGGHPEYHIQGDVINAIKAGRILVQDGSEYHVPNWDAAIFHPDCTYLTVSANKWYKDQPPRKSGVLVGQARRDARAAAYEFFMELWNCKIPRVTIENPIGVMSTYFRKPNQILQPWQFGHGETKATCLWTRGLPDITPTGIVEGREQKLHYLPPSKDRAELRSKTFSGIAKALAKQYTDYLLNDIRTKEKLLKYSERYGTASITKKTL